MFIPNRILRRKGSIHQEVFILILIALSSVLLGVILLLVLKPTGGCTDGLTIHIGEELSLLSGKVAFPIAGHGSTYLVEVWWFLTEGHVQVIGSRLSSLVVSGVLFGLHQDIQVLRLLVSRLVLMVASGIEIIEASHEQLSVRFEGLLVLVAVVCYSPVVRVVAHILLAFVDVSQDVSHVCGVRFLVDQFQRFFGLESFFLRVRILTGLTFEYLVMRLRFWLLRMAHRILLLLLLLSL